MKIIDVVQGSPEWRDARLGHFTASTAHDLITCGSKGQELKARRDLIEQLTAERLTNTLDDGFNAFATERGKELEASAREAYEFETGLDVQEVGFCVHDDIPYVGCSPDGLVGEEGGVEFKCPKSLKKHFNNVRSNAHVDEYRWQVQACLFVTGRRWWDIVSFDPRFPKYPLAIARLTLDTDDKKTIYTAFIDGNAQISKMLSEIDNIKRAV